MKVVARLAAALAVAGSSFAAMTSSVSAAPEQGWVIRLDAGTTQLLASDQVKSATAALEASIAPMPVSDLASIASFASFAARGEAQDGPLACIELRVPDNAGIRSSGTGYTRCPWSAPSMTRYTGYASLD